MIGSINRKLVLATLVCAIGLVTAARVEQQHELSLARISEAGERAIKQLNTYYFDVSAPHIQLSPRTSSRPERTAVTVKVAEGSVSRFMPVVSPQAAGMTHAVSDTWQALRNLATMFTHVDAVNKQHPTAERLFPRAALAVSGASDNAPVKLDMDAIINRAEAMGNRNAWAEVTPSSVLLLPAGQSTGAVADVLDVSFDPQTNTIALELDVVHEPQTISEFEPHAKQTLDVRGAHYHFSTAPGVKVDAHALLKSLQSGSGFAVQGMHVFMKGFACRYPATVSADKTQAAVGTEVTITVTVGTCARRTARNHGSASVDTSPTRDGGYEVVVGIVGNAQFVFPSQRGSPHTPGTKQSGSTQTIYTTGSTGTFNVRITGSGCVTVNIILIDSNPPSVPVAAEINCVRPVHKVKLMPHKAYRHVHDAVTLTALALDAFHQPVAGANISFSEHGDCDGHIDQAAVITGVNGVAAVQLVADRPGVVSVVAAGVDAKGTPVLSEPSNIFYFTERYEADHREQEYYGEDYDGEHLHEDSDAYGYAKSAAQRVQQMIQKAA